MLYEPVCDEEGNIHDNKQCALCAGIAEEQLQACPQLGLLDSEEYLI